MSDDSLARSQPDAPLSVDPDYDAIHATIVATETGRWFLDEYARRYRGADTELVLAAVERIGQTIRGGITTDPGDTVQRELSIMAEAIRQTRSEVVGRHGDPAASGEAAIADFRHAAEEVHALVWAAQQQQREGGAELDTQLSFQTNRLTVAGDRLERSVAALRLLLGLLDELDERMRLIVGTDEPAAPMASEPARPASAAVTLPPGAVFEEEPIPQPPSAGDEPLRNLAAASPEIAQDRVPAPAGPVSEAIVTDWAFAPDEAEPAPQPPPPPDVAAAPEPPPAAAPISALERLEAREYGRQTLAAALAPPPPDPDDVVVPADSVEVPAAGAEHAEPRDFDDLVMGTVSPAGEPEPKLPAPEWFAEPAATQVAEPLFDADLFDTDGNADPALGAASDLSEGLELLATDEPPHDHASAPGDTEPAYTEPAFAEPAYTEPASTEPEYAAPAHTKPNYAEAARAEPAMFMSELTEGSAPEHRPAGGHEYPLSDEPSRQPAPISATPARPAPLRTPAAAGLQPPAGDPGVDTPTVLQRLESMRSAIASLMEEVSEKRRTPPRQS